MKNILSILILCLVANVAVAQQCNKDVKNKYVLVDGLIEATLFHDNGTIAQKGYYTPENKLQGEWISYDTNGNKTAVAQYNNGDKVGTWKFYQGETIKEVTYSNSRIAKVKTWKSKDTRVVTYR